MCGSVDEYEHLWPSTCDGCGMLLEMWNQEVCTGTALSVLELERTPGGIRIACVEHRYQVVACACRHEAEARPAMGVLSLLDGRKRQLYLRGLRGLIHAGAEDQGHTILNPIQARLIPSSLDVGTSRPPSDGWRPHPQARPSAQGRTGPQSRPDTADVSLSMLGGIKRACKLHRDHETEKIRTLAREIFNVWDATASASAPAPKRIAPPTPPPCPWSKRAVAVMSICGPISPKHLPAQEPAPGTTQFPLRHEQSGEVNAYVG
jgi:hypothetical protein